MKNKKIKIIAGPCSIDKKNIEDIYKIAEIKIKGKFAIWGIRMVGLKSRTNFNKKGEGMGIDFKTFIKNLDIFKKEKSFKKLTPLPSIKIASELIKKTKVLVATEIMEPILQLPFFESFIPQNKAFLWNPAVNQLGWDVFITSRYVKENKWFLGIKNPKWLGETPIKSKNYKEKTSAEKTWEGLVSYTDLNKERIFLIHRGFDVFPKKNYRNLPLHSLAERVKKATGCFLFFDPSHSLGPKMRDLIVEETIKAMKIKISKDEYLYDGILIESGRSETDKDQHISVEELKELCYKLSTFRDFEKRK